MNNTIPNIRTVQREIGNPDNLLRSQPGLVEEESLADRGDSELGP